MSYHHNAVNIILIQTEQQMMMIGVRKGGVTVPSSTSAGGVGLATARGIGAASHVTVVKDPVSRVSRRSRM